MVTSSVLLLCAAASAPAPQEVPVPAFDPALKTLGDLSAWQRAHVTLESEQPWLSRPWQLDLANAVEQAWRESKPLALWLGDGHPFGAASATELALKPAWHDPEVSAASRDFVLAADDWNELRAARAGSPALDRWLARLEAEAPLAAGLVLFAAPDGTPLGRVRASSAEELVSACAEAAAAWEQRGADSFPIPVPAERPGPLPRFHRLADALPLDGLALELAHRGCDDPALGPPEVLTTGWNRDWFWIDAAALQILRPQGPGMGPKVELPSEIAVPLTGLILADSSFGRAAPFRADEVKHAWLQVEPRAMRRGMRGCQLKGEMLAERGGRWEAEDENLRAAGVWHPEQPDGVRARARLYGWMEVDVATERILSLQLCALVQTAGAGGVRHHLVTARRADPADDSTRIAPSWRAPAVRVAAHDARGPLPRGYRAFHAGSLPQIDGSLDELVWAASAWTEEFGPGGCARILWTSELLYLGVWSPQPALALRAQGVTLEVDEQGKVSGPASARAEVRAHEGGWVYEIAIPWVALERAGGAPAPAAGGFAAVNLRVGGESATWWSPAEDGAPADARVLLLPSRSAGFTLEGFR